LAAYRPQLPQTIKQFAQNALAARKARDMLEIM
jgi:hypothetical protein